MAFAAADYKFLFVDIGANGSYANSGVFKETNLYKALIEEYAGLPDPEPLPNNDSPIKYSFIGDDAFGLWTWLMKPNPSRGLTRQKRIFHTDCRGHAEWLRMILASWIKGK